MRSSVLVVVGALIAACSSSSPPPAPPVTCCPPSPKPECCMAMGGAKGEACESLTCDIPDPNAPGWKLAKDTDGCMRWFAPAGDWTGCSAPVVDAGPPPIDPCVPTDVSTWTPATMHPPATPASACTQQQLGDFWDACLNGTLQQCNAFQSANTTCSSCLLTNDTAPSWGVFVVSSQVSNPNVGGCVALKQSLACGQAVDAVIQCELDACASCVASENASALRKEQCVQEADATGCKAYLDQECSLNDAGVEACFWNDKATFVPFASVFCNP